jgi:hypothetical protein
MVFGTNSLQLRRANLRGENWPVELAPRCLLDPAQAPDQASGDRLAQDPRCRIS